VLTNRKRGVENQKITVQTLAVFKAFGKLKSILCVAAENFYKINIILQEEIKTILNSWQTLF
jgi:hypothetical protein